MANPRRRLRALRYCGAGGWPVGLPETIFGATAKASATASLAPASVVLALGSGRTGFPKQVSERRKAGGSWTPPRHMRPKAYVATRARIIKGKDQGSGRNGRFINKRTNGQIFRFGLRMADFILSRLRSSSVAKPSHFYQGLAEWQLYQGRRRSGRFIKADGSFIKAGQPMAVLSTMAALSRLRTRPVAAMAVISLRSGQMADFILSRTSSLSTARSTFLERAGKASGRFIRPASRILLLLLPQLLRKLLIKLLM